MTGIESDLQNGAILIVDDTPDNPCVLADYLNDTRHETIVASNGEDGVTTARKALPDLILPDVQMPDIKFMGHGI